MASIPAAGRTIVNNNTESAAAQLAHTCFSSKDHFQYHHVLIFLVGQVMRYENKYVIHPLNCSRPYVNLFNIYDLFDKMKKKNVKIYQLYDGWGDYWFNNIQQIYIGDMTTIYKRVSLW